MRKFFLLSFATLILSISFPLRGISNTTESYYLDEVSYTSIAISDLPEAVIDSYSNKYNNIFINKAFEGNDSTYKLEATIEGESHLLIIYEDGLLVTDDSSN